jgi:hypothetical protein
MTWSTMRDDLLDAQASVDWAVAQIPLLQTALFDWCKEHPYEVTEEPDTELGGYAVVAQQSAPFLPIHNAWAGVIINSLRSSLDLLAAALATRNGHNPGTDTHFPIFVSEQEMIDPLTGVEGKKWLSKRQQAAIKTLKPYNGGDGTIWPLHKLDILRKHERLIDANPDVRRFFWERGTVGEKGGYMMFSGFMGIERLKNKTVLFRYGGPAVKSLDAAEGYTHIAAHITFNEGILGMADHEVAATLSRFAKRVSEIIKLFDTP